MKFIIFVLVLAGVGYWYYTAYPSDVKKAREAGEVAVDTGTMASLEGAAKIAKNYFLKNNNYGISTTKNICMNVTSENGFGDVLAGIKKLGGVVTCTVDSNFPTKSFTLTIPSLAKKGQYYCIDQNQSVELIPSIKNVPFSPGLMCK